MDTSKLTALSALATATDDDILYIVDDPAGTASSYKITLANLRTSLVPGVRVVQPSGDTTGVADVTAIQAAMDAITGGGTVYLTPGSYYTASTILIPKRVGIEGIGNIGTHLTAASPVVITHAPATDIPLFRSTYTAGDDVKRYIGPIRGLNITKGGSCTNAIFLESVYEIRIDRCALMNFKTGLKIQDTICTVIEQCYVEGTHVTDSYCINLVAGSSQSTTVMIRDSRLRWAEYAVRVNDNACHSTTLSDCIFESCLKGILRTSDGYNRVRNAYTESMNSDGLSTLLVVADDTATYELSLLNSVNAQRQDAPAAIADGDTAITIANLQAKILTMASSTAPRAPTVPTGTAVYGTVSVPVVDIGQAIDWTFINTGNQTVTITANTDHTLVGSMAVAANTQKSFRTRCSATNTAITYSLS